MELNKINFDYFAMEPGFNNQDNPKNQLLQNNKNYEEEEFIQGSHLLSTIPHRHREPYYHRRGVGPNDLHSSSGSGSGTNESHQHSQRSGTYQVKYKGSQGQAAARDTGPIFKIFLTGLSYNFTPSEMKAFFKRMYPSTKKVFLPKSNGRGSGCGLLIVQDKAAYEAILRKKQFIYNTRRFFCNPFLREEALKEYLENLEKRRVFVSKVPYFVETDQVRHLFSQFGELEDLYLIRNNNYATGKGFGFVMFQTIQAARKALEAKAVHFKGSEMLILPYKKKSNNTNKKKVGKNEEDEAQEQGRRLEDDLELGSPGFRGQDGPYLSGSGRQTVGLQQDAQLQNRRRKLVQRYDDQKRGASPSMIEMREHRRESQQGSFAPLVRYQEDAGGQRQYQSNQFGDDEGYGEYDAGMEDDGYFEDYHEAPERQEQSPGPAPSSRNYLVPINEVDDQIYQDTHQRARKKPRGGSRKAPVITRNYNRGGYPRSERIEGFDSFEQELFRNAYKTMPGEAPKKRAYTGPDYGYYENMSQDYKYQLDEEGYEQYEDEGYNESGGGQGYPEGVISKKRRSPRIYSTKGFGAGDDKGKIYDPAPVRRRYYERSVNQGSQQDGSGGYSGGGERRQDRMQRALDQAKRGLGQPRSQDFFEEDSQHPIRQHPNTRYLNYQEGGESSNQGQSGSQRQNSDDRVPQNNTPPNVDTNTPPEPFLFQQLGGFAQEQQPEQPQQQQPITDQPEQGSRIYRGVQFRAQGEDSQQQARPDQVAQRLRINVLNGERREINFSYKSNSARRDVTKISKQLTSDNRHSGANLRTNGVHNYKYFDRLVASSINQRRKAGVQI